MPTLKHVIQSYDTAFSKKQTADYSAITTWGIFTPHESMADAIILIDAIKGKYDFPELKWLLSININIGNLRQLSLRLRQVDKVYYKN